MRQHSAGVQTDGERGGRATAEVDSVSAHTQRQRRQHGPVQTSDGRLRQAACRSVRGSQAQNKSKLFYSRSCHQSEAEGNAFSAPVQYSTVRSAASMTSSVHYAAGTRRQQPAHSVHPLIQRTDTTLPIRCHLPSAATSPSRSFARSSDPLRLAVDTATAHCTALHCTSPHTRTHTREPRSIALSLSRPACLPACLPGATRPPAQPTC